MSNHDWRPAVDRALELHRHQPGPLLLVLQAVQEATGFIPPEAVPVIADDLNLSRAEVHGVVSFYHDFRTTPPGRHRVAICRAEACQAVGADRLVGVVKDRLGVESHGTSGDGAVTVDPVYCLGNCALSPAVMIDGHLHGRVSPERFGLMLDAIRGNAP